MLFTKRGYDKDTTEDFREFSLVNVRPTMHGRAGFII